MYKMKNRMMPTTFNGMLNNMFSDNWEGFFNDDKYTYQNVPVNIKESDNSYMLDVVAPGLKKEDFNIAVDNDLLTISFEQKEAKEENTDKVIRSEYKFRSFKRSFTMSDMINAAEISAKYEDGVLSLVLPKKEEAKKLNKTIKIS